MSVSTRTILEAKNLSFMYEGSEKNALSNVSISFKQGETIAILGGNGAGKSTLFLTLNGILKPKEGEIFYDGVKIKLDKRGIRDLRKHVGIVFQDPNDQLFSSDVRNDIAFGALNLGVSDQDAHELVDEYARLSGVYDLLDKPTHALSFGQKKRVAIAGVLVMKPEIIILDEPTAGLDPIGVSEILNLLSDIKLRKGTTLIISTHDIDLVPLYCDFAYVFNQGKVEIFGTPREIFKNKEKLREIGLRVPRISHLMEILSTKDNIDVNLDTSTISEARHVIKELIKHEKC